MRASHLVPIALLTLGLAFAAGYGVAQRRHAPPPPRVQIGPALSGLAGEVQAALLMQDRVEGVHTLSGILARSGPEALSEILAGFDSVFVDVAEIETVLLTEWWAAFDPEAAFRWSQKTRVANYQLVIRSALRAWARRDPIAARGALERIADPITRRACYDGLVAGWEDSGRPGLLEYLHDMLPSIEQLRALAAVARRKVLREGPEAAFRWVESLPEDRDDEIGRFKLQLFRRVASEAALVDHERTAAWALRHSDGPNGDGLLGRVGAAWSLSDGPGAMAWLATLPEHRQRNDAVEETYQAWLDRDPAAALAWMRDAPPEPWLDWALSVYAVASSTADPEQALAAAARVSDSERRDNAIITIVRLWRANAPAAADAWLERADLDPALRAAILTATGPGAGGAAPQPTADGVAPGERESAQPEQP